LKKWQIVNVLISLLAFATDKPNRNEAEREGALIRFGILSESVGHEARALSWSPLSSFVIGAQHLQILTNFY
jgi:hypothetical protein